MQLRRIQYEYSILFFPTEHSLFGKMLQKMKFIVCFLSFCQSNMIVALSKKKFATSIQICHPRCSSCHSYQTRLIEIYFAIKNLSSNSIHVMPLQMVPKMQCPVGLYTFILFYPWSLHRLCSSCCCGIWREAAMGGWWVVGWWVVRSGQRMTVASGSQATVVPVRMPVNRQSDLQT